ncbi:MAG TPA: choice-of-anchor D domain-containing protein, partial [Candidatus Acidoferrales bacterium]|nr:choice-of-anchor D domain-containing protein [Candidatus Acidoferrales bacterium]
IAADLLGNNYLAGFTSQPGSGFPTKNGFQTTYGGGAYDAFLMCISPNGLGSQDLLYSTFLGGSNSDQAFAVAVDGAIPANAYLAGSTQSSAIFTAPTISGYQTTLNGMANGFFAVVSLTTAGAASLNYGTYFGGSESDSALAVDALGEDAVYLAGNTTSPNFPTYQTLQAFSGTNDGFVAKFDTTQPGAASLLYSTLLGGRNAAQVNGVAATALGSVFVAGSTTSPDFPLAGNPQTGEQLTCPSCQESPPLPDAFLVALAENATIGPIVSFNAPQLNFGNQLVGSANPPEASQITNAGTLPLAIGGVAIVGANAGDFSQSNDCPIAPNLLAAGANCAISVTFSPSIAGAESAALSFADNAPGSPQSVDLNGTGEEPVASATPAIVSFGNQAVGTVNQQVVTLANSGNLALNITNVSITGLDVAQFGYGGLDTCGNAPLQQGANCMVGVDFQPTMTGNFSAQLQFTDNTGNVPGSVQSIQISGNGVTAAPGVSVAPAVLTFASQVVGTTSGPQTISMTNTGSLTAQVSTISIAGPNAPEFAFASGSNCPISGGTLAASASCNVNVAFTPSVTGSQSAIVLFADNASGSPQSVSLSGTGSSAVLTVSPSSLSFSSQTLEVLTSPQTVSLQNSGATAINISSIAISGSNPTDFTQSNNCPGTLNPPSQTNPHPPSCTISIQFDPIAGGVLSATLLVTDNASGSPQSVPLSGTGLVPSVSMSPSSLAFAPQAVGSSSAASPIEVTNAGNGALAISGLAFTGADPSDFSATQNCGTSLVPGGSCQISVIFAPTTAGSRSAYLNVTDNSPSSPQVIPVTGDGTNFSIGMQPGAPQSIVVSAGGTATYNLQVSPAGGFSGSVAITCTGAPPSAACAADPASVSVTGQAPVAFAVNVTTAAATTETNGNERSSKNDQGHRAPMIVAMIAILALAYITPLYFATNRGRRRARTFARGIALILFVWSVMTACSGGGQPALDSQGTPAGTYTLTVTGTNQKVTSTTSLTLDVQ